VDLRVPSPIGDVCLAVSAAGVRTLGFAGPGRDPGRRPAAVGPGRDVAEAAVAAIRDFFAGDVAALDDVPLDVGGTPFQRRVWAAMRAVPAGTAITYAELAARVRSAPRAVGSAGAANPVSLFTPCHRIIGSRGSLTGYLWGLERKRWLLAHEAAATGAPAHH
jgi:methylated-DNA-[protein]-cysteine S-methyltransferase